MMKSHEKMRFHSKFGPVIDPIEGYMINVTDDTR